MVNKVYKRHKEISLETIQVQVRGRSVAGKKNKHFIFNETFK